MRTIIVIFRTAVAILIWCVYSSSAVAAPMQNWPEVDAFVDLPQERRLFFLAKLAKDRNSPSQELEIGANIDFFLTPAVGGQKKLAPEERQHDLMVRVGYRHLRSIGSSGEPYRENRGVIEATPRFHLSDKVTLSNRNRLDLRWIEGQGYSTRYRNRIKLEWETAIGEFLFIPYSNVEAFYDTRFHAWSRYIYDFGIEFPINEHLAFDAYYRHQQDRNPENTLNVLGIKVKLYY